MILILGGGGGIGRVACQTLAKEGARIVVSDINIESAKNTVETLTGNVLMVFFFTP